MSTRTLSSPKIAIRLTGSVTNTMDDLSGATIAHPLMSYNKNLSSGVSAGQANRAWQSERRSIASGAQEIIDVYDFDGIDIGGGVGNDGLGQSLLLEEIVGIAIVNDNLVTEAGQLEILPSSSEGWEPIGSHTVANGGALYGQGALLKFNIAEAAFDVSPTSHRIMFRAVGGAVSYSVYIYGRHDDDESSSSSSSSVSSSSASSLSSSTSSLSTSSASESSTSSLSSSSPSSSSSSTSSTSSLSSSSSSASSESSSSLSSNSSSSP